MATLTVTPTLKGADVCRGDFIVGCDYLLRGNKLYFSETDGEIDEFNFSTGKHTIGFGTGYKKLQDIRISRDGRHAYVTEDEGNLLRVDLLKPNRANALLISSGMKNPRQIFLDEHRSLAYVIESGRQGRLLRIHLPPAHMPIHPIPNPATNHFPVATGFFGGMGLLLSADRQFAYVSQEMPVPMRGGGQVLRVHLNSGNKVVLVQGLNHPGFLAWLGSGEHTILVTEHGANDVVLLDLTKAPVTHTVLGDVAVGPTGLCLVGTDLYVATSNEIDKLTLVPYKATGPILLGIGHVPKDNIVDGFATTDANYFFHVVDAPFGGSLPLMFNHDFARDTVHAGYYKVFTRDLSDPTAGLKEVPTVQYWDYCLDPATLTFKLTANPSTPGDYYEVHKAGELWMNQWLGAFLNSNMLANGKYRIVMQMFDTNLPGNHALGDGWVDVVVDNGWPTAHIDSIKHGTNEIDACAVESLSTGDDWTFGLTAIDPEQHFKSWSLIAMWGDNKSDAIASEEYNPAAHPDHLWAGLAEPDTVPAIGAWHAARTGDPTSTKCAHTFYLGVWDRVINGEDYLHYNYAMKSITIVP